MNDPDTPTSASSSGRATSAARYIGLAVAYVLAIAGLASWYVAVQRPAQQRFEAECRHLREARGAVVVRTEPAGALVRVGGFVAEKSPLTFPAARPGRYPLQIVLDGYDPLEQTIDVSESQTTDLGTIKLARSTGTVALMSEPSGLPVKLRMTRPDGGCEQVPERSETTPATVTLPTGAYEVTVEREGLISSYEKRSVVVTRNQSQVVKTQFPSGTLRLSSEAEGTSFEVTYLPAPSSEVEIVATGATPAVLELPAGITYQVHFEARGHESSFKTCKLEAGETEDIAAHLAESKPAAGASPVPAGKNWENSLGMRFVPVPGVSALFSIWDTRVSDYRQFVQETRRPWRMPPFRQESDHPVVQVSWDDAKAFCAWLTERERSSGQLAVTQQYRLPTDAEWSAAVGLCEEANRSPHQLSLGVKGVYFWGMQWPATVGVGNYGGDLQLDPFECTSPVGSFPANRFGLYDMGGNVWQWCEDFYEIAYRWHPRKTLRGGSYLSNEPGELLASVRGKFPAEGYHPTIGFRCVLTVAEPLAAVGTREDSPVPDSHAKDGESPGAVETLAALGQKGPLGDEPASVAQGAVRIESEPSGAEVRLYPSAGCNFSRHFLFRGTTPLVLDGVPAGDLEISLNLPGYQPVFSKAKIVAHQVVGISEKLRPEPSNDYVVGDTGLALMAVESSSRPFWVSRITVPRWLVEFYHIPLPPAVQNPAINKPYEEYENSLEDEAEAASAYEQQQALQNRAENLRQDINAMRGSNNARLVGDMEHEHWSVSQQLRPVAAGPSLGSSPLSHLNRQQREEQRCREQAAWARKQPAEIAWDRAQEFCRQLTASFRDELPDGYRFALPTEEQWKRAWFDQLRNNVATDVRANGWGKRPSEWCADVAAQKDGYVCYGFHCTYLGQFLLPEEERHWAPRENGLAFRVALVPDPEALRDGWAEKTHRDNAAQTRRDPTDELEGSPFSGTSGAK